MIGISSVVLSVLKYAYTNEESRSSSALNVNVGLTLIFACLKLVPSEDMKLSLITNLPLNVIEAEATTFFKSFTTADPLVSPT